MSNFEPPIGGIPARVNPSRTSTDLFGRASGAPAKAPQRVFIQIGDASKRANIFRDDFEIPVFEVDPDVFDDIIVNRPTVKNKVIAQTPAAGTIVAKGTAIDITLAPPENLPGRVVQGGHRFFAERALEETFTGFIAGNQTVLNLLNRNPDPTKLSSNDIDIATQIAQENDVTIGEAPGERVQDFVTSLAATRALMG